MGHVMFERRPEEHAIVTAPTAVSRHVSPTTEIAARTRHIYLRNLPTGYDESENCYLLTQVDPDSSIRSHRAHKQSDTTVHLLPATSRHVRDSTKTKAGQQLRK